MDWNGDGAINDRDLYHYDANKPDDEGFYLEWSLYTYYTHYWGALVPEYNCDEYHRGNPDDFPQAPGEMPTCEEACERMGACGSADHPIYPMTTEECLDVCEIFRSIAPQNPDYVDMRAFEFEACTHQPTCEQVEGCGGWLYRPHLADEICPTYCHCSHAPVILSDPSDGLTCESPVEMTARAPKGSRFSGRRIYLSQPTEPRRSGGFDQLHAEHVENHGNYSLLTYETEIDQKLLARRAGDATVLPTFEDDSGRVVAATGTLFVRPGSKQGLDAIRDRLGPHGLRLSAKMKGDPMFADQWHLQSVWPAFAVSARSFRECPASWPREEGAFP